MNPCLRCHKEIIRCSIYIELTANFRVRETHLSYSFICAFDDNTNLSYTEMTKAFCVRVLSPSSKNFFPLQGFQYLRIKDKAYRMKLG